MTIRYNIDKFFDYLVRRRAWEVLNSDCGFDWYDNKQNQYIIDDTFKFIHESTNIRIMAIIFKDKRNHLWVLMVNGILLVTMICLSRVGLLTNK